MIKEKKNKMKRAYFVSDVIMCRKSLRPILNWKLKRLRLIYKEINTFHIIIFKHWTQVKKKKHIIWIFWNDVHIDFIRLQSKLVIVNRQDRRTFQWLPNPPPPSLNPNHGLYILDTKPEIIQAIPNSVNSVHFGMPWPKAWMPRY